jgi:DNA-binding XRE family transcriptional regulator
MSGRNKFSELREAFLNDPERGVARREEIEALGRAYDALVALHELREAAGATQADVAHDLGVSQPYVAKLEKRGDMSLTTLSSYLAALGGRLEVRAIFPEHPEENVALALPAVESAAGRESLSGK